MRIVKSLLLAGLGAALVASSAFAQDGRVHAQKPPGRGQVATAGAAIPPAQPLGPGRAYGGEAYDGGGYFGDPYTSSYYVPTVVGADGRVYANFGYGYEQVTRECASRGYVTYGARAPRTVRQPVYTQPGVTQPVPTAPTASQTMIQRNPGNAGAAVGGVSVGGFYVGQSQAANGACWMRGGGGRVVVRR